jgi:predicted Zn-ribbon and HTH transcriptional regulator
VFDTRLEAADDNSAGEAPELIATLKCSECGYSFTLPVDSEDRSVRGTCPKCNVQTDGVAIPTSSDE